MTTNQPTAPSRDRLAQTEARNLYEWHDPKDLRAPKFTTCHACFLPTPNRQIENDRCPECRGETPQRASEGQINERWGV